MAIENRKRESFTIGAHLPVNDPKEEILASNIAKLAKQLGENHGFSNSENIANFVFRKVEDNLRPQSCEEITKIVTRVLKSELKNQLERELGIPNGKALTAQFFENYKGDLNNLSLQEITDAAMGIFIENEKKSLKLEVPRYTFLADMQREQTTPRTRSKANGELLGLLEEPLGKKRKQNPTP